LRTDYGGQQERQRCAHQDKGINRPAALGFGIALMGDQRERRRK
jgi:hypothetical protein